MATSALISVSEYLRTSYHPECEYVDGKVLERNVGEIPHGGLQVLIGSLFYQNRAVRQLRPLLAVRVQVSPTRIRVPDVCVVRPQDTRDEIVRVPPVTCIEIVCREDTLFGL